MRNDFAIFILSHGRANNLITLKTLDKIGYTGKTYIIIDNEDEQEEEYKKLNVEDVIIFDKNKMIEKTDTADNFKDHRLVVYARNKCWDIAKKLGIKYFLVLDDDYSSFDFRFIKDNKFKAKKIQNADKLFLKTIEFLEKSGALTIAYAQAGDFIGGKDNGNYKKEVLRKAMNTFFCMTDRPFKFSGSTNEDVNAYITYGMKGKLMFTITKVSVVQKMTQQNPGGLTDIYLDNGTYVKSFYSVIHEPSCVKVALMGSNNKRIHHKINWDKCCPKILNEKWKKE